MKFLEVNSDFTLTQYVYVCCCGMRKWVKCVSILAVVSFLMLITMIERHEYGIFDSNLHSASFQTTSRLFYVYNWTEDIVNSVPSAYSHHRLSITPDFLTNNGAGRLINAQRCMYHTHQYSLFLIMYPRLLSSPYRTLNPEEASLFFIPYDLGMDSSTRSSDGALFKTNCPRVDRVMNLLQSSPYFQRNAGKDHFLLHSINHMMTYYANQQCTRLYRLCFNCTKLSIDVYPSSVYPTLASEPHMTHNWLSVPFPSDYHYSSGASQVPWRHFTSPLSQTSQYKAERPYLLSFVGSVQVTAKKQRELRQSLISACEQLNAVNPHNCLLLSLDSHESMTPHYLNNSSSFMSSASSSEINPYSVSRLCLMPGGDFPTRKGFLDAMLAGCVPVTFQLIAAQDQWPLHWISRDNAMQCTLFLDREAVMKDVQAAMGQLLAVAENFAVMQEKLWCIAKMAHRFQYSLNSDGSSKGLVDAVDVIIDQLLKV